MKASEDWIFAFYRTDHSTDIDVDAISLKQTQTRTVQGEGRLSNRYEKPAIAFDRAEAANCATQRSVAQGGFPGVIHANKKVSGRKQPITVDTDGWLLAVILNCVNAADSEGAQMILEELRERSPCVKHLFGDVAYDRKRLMET